MLEKRRAKKALKRNLRDDEEVFWPHTVRKQDFYEFNFKVDVTTETTTLHINDPNDYLGRNYLHPPQDEAVNLNKPGAPSRCFLPKKLIHTYKGHTKVFIESIDCVP